MYVLHCYTLDPRKPLEAIVQLLLESVMDHRHGWRAPHVGAKVPAVQINMPAVASLQKDVSAPELSQRLDRDVVAEAAKQAKGPRVDDVPFVGRENASPKHAVFTHRSSRRRVHE